MTQAANEPRRKHLKRVSRAWRISGRRLATQGERWGVFGGLDGRMKARLPLEQDEVEQLAREVVIVALDSKPVCWAGLATSMEAVANA